jgi:hypothetical protein
LDFTGKITLALKKFPASGKEKILLLKENTGQKKKKEKEMKNRKFFCSNSLFFFLKKKMKQLATSADCLPRVLQYSWPNRQPCVL